MTTTTRSTMLPSFQQPLGVTPRDGRRAGRRWTRRSAIALGAAGTLGAFGLLACGAPAVPGASYVKPISTAGSRPLKIAVLAPLTGGGASIGAQQLGFARLAIEEFNRANGTSYNILEADTELDPAKAASVAHRLAGDKDVLAVIGPAGSQEVSAAAPVLALSSLAMISPSATNTELTERGYRNFFRVVPRDDVQGATDARFISDRLGAKQVWIVDEQTSYSTGLAKEVKAALKARGLNVAQHSIRQSDTDFSALVTRLKADAPDVVFIPWQQAAQGALFARQIAEQRVETTLMGADGMFVPSEFIGGAAGATEGAYVSFFAPDVSDLDVARPVVEAYRARHGEVGPFGAPAYAATRVALEAIQRAQANGPLSLGAVTAEVARTNQATSILGQPIAFDSRGDILEASFFLFQVRDGRFVPVTTDA